MLQVSLIFSADGFPLWIAILGLLFAAFRLCGSDGKLQSFDRKSIVPLRGLLAALVYLGHLKGHCPWATEWLPWVSWATPAVAVFFFLSGYGLCKGYEGKGEGYLSGFLFRSFVKIARPLVPVVITYALWLQWHGRFMSLFWRFWRDGNTPVPNTWYVYALLLMYFLWWMAWRLGQKTVVRLGVLWAGVVAYFCMMEFVLDWNFVWARTILAFPLGATFAVHERRIRSVIEDSPMKVYLLVVALLSLAILIRACVSNGVVSIAGRGLTSTLGLYVILTWYALPLPDLKALRFLGRISYEIYLVHGVVIALALPVLKHGFGCFACVVTIGSLLAAVGLNRLMVWCGRTKFISGKEMKHDWSHSMG